MTRRHKSEFLEKISERSNVPVKTVAKIYDTIVETVHDELAEGNTVSLSGFGSFYLIKHKGHEVQFSESDSISDYIVVKFSASAKFNKIFREEYAAGYVKLQ